MGSSCRKVPSQLMLDPTSFTLPTRREVSMLLQCTNVCRQLYTLNISSLSPLLHLTKQLMQQCWVSFKSLVAVKRGCHHCVGEQGLELLELAAKSSSRCSALFKRWFLNAYVLQAYLLLTDTVQNLKMQCKDMLH